MYTEKGENGQRWEEHQQRRGDEKEPGQKWVGLVRQPEELGPAGMGSGETWWVLELRSQG